MAPMSFRSRIQLLTTIVSTVSVPSRKPVQSCRSKSAKPDGWARSANRVLHPRFLAALLALTTAILYWSGLGDSFLNYDDELYVTSNSHVKVGLSLEGLNWSLLNTVAGNWHPITVWSHMLDVEVFGLSAWGHHLC